MTTRENERPGERGHKQKPTTLTELAIEIVKDDPEASDTKLRRRWVRQVEDDEDLRNDCLEAQAAHEIKIARNTVAREKTKTKAKTSGSRQRQQKITAQFEEVIVEARRTLFDLTAENGKKIRELTGNELERLETNNATRAKLYHELRKRVKGNEVVGDVLDDKKFTTIMSKIGDVQELSKLFG